MSIMNIHTIFRKHCKVSEKMSQVTSIDSYLFKVFRFPFPLLLSHPSFFMTSHGKFFRTLCRASIYSFNEESTRKEETTGDLWIQCLPLYSMLLAMDNPTVNYLRYNIFSTNYHAQLELPDKGRAIKYKGLALNLIK